MRLKPYLLLLLMLLPLNAFALQVSTGIEPITYLAEQIGGKHAQVSNLIAAGREPHTFEPTPRQISQLNQADLYLTIQLPFEEALTPKLQVKVVDISRNIVRRPISDHEGDNHHGHDEAPDPHIWLGNEQIKTLAHNIQHAFSQADPANGAAYQLNLENFLSALDRIDSQIRQQLLPFKGQHFFVFHPAFGYFADSYQLEQVAIETGGKSPSPRQIASIVNRTRKENVRIIFVQAQFDPRSANTIAQATGAAVVPLDPLAHDILANLDSIAKELAKALNK